MMKAHPVLYQISTDFLTFLFPLDLFSSKKNKGDNKRITFVIFVIQTNELLSFIFRESLMQDAKLHF